MKTIQIPTTSNPFIVNINNHGYQYRAGDTIEVPDEVAEAIEDALELEPKAEVQKSKIARLTEDSLEEITAEDLAGISTLSRCAFYWRINLKSVKIPDNITTLSAYSFAYCSGLKAVYLPEVPPTLGADCFKSAPSSCTFYCKTQESLDAYKAAPDWSTLTGTYSFVVEA